MPNMMPSFNHADGYTFNPVILREYDIRGQVGKNLNVEDAYALGLAFGTMIARDGGSRICVGFDGRTTSSELSDALIDGLVSTGMHVENIGLGPTPMLSFAVKYRQADAGIMVTGSHNPADYNGFKMSLQASPIFGETIQEIGRIAASGEFISGLGSEDNIDIQDAYVDRLLQDLSFDRDISIAWDNGNGAAGEILRRLTAKLPGQHILLFDDIDGSFPNHHPDPTVDQNLIDLQKAVADNNCCLLYTSPSPRDRTRSRMPSSA